MDHTDKQWEIVKPLIPEEGHAADQKPGYYQSVFIETDIIGPIEPFSTQTTLKPSPKDSISRGLLIPNTRETSKPQTLDSS